MIAEMENIGLEVKVDGVGNIRGRLSGSDNAAPAILSGSHIDSVYHGGMFDGIVGVIGALEALNVIAENDIVTRKPVEVIVFAEEEGSNFTSTMAGSKALIGKYTADDLKSIKNDKGMSMYETAKTFGLDADNVDKYLIKKGDIAAMLELHIEQSVVLDNEKLSIGIVEAIYGSVCLAVTFTGTPNHAGATPMNLRNDPMVAAASYINELTKFTVNKAYCTTVCTIGKISCEPNVSNVIAGEVTFTVDIRDVNEAGIKMVEEKAESLAKEMSKISKTSYSIKKLARSDVIALSPEIANVIEQAAKASNVSYRRMNSGAVHDSAMLAQVTDVGMIFVPSIGGRSHVPEESTSFEDIKAGCDVLLKTILRLSQEN